MANKVARGGRFFAPLLLVMGISVAMLNAAAAQSLAPGRYAIDSEASKIHWRVYKAGAFARFGHNHVIAIPAPSGQINVAAVLADSQVELAFSVADLVIDDPALRSLYGEDFASEPSESDIAGTKTNMLTEQVLNGELFPSITVVGSGLTGIGPGQSINLAVSMLGRVVELTVPVSVELNDGSLRVRGDFRLTHEDLGMVPFSVMMGALQVGNEIDFTLDIVANAQTAL